MLPFWKIFGLFVLFTLVSSKKISFARTRKVDDVFKSITYNLTLAPNFEKFTFDGFLLLKVIPKIDVSEFSMSKGNYNVNITIAEMENSDFVLEEKNETLTVKLLKPFIKGQKYLISLHFNNLKIRNDMTGFYKIKISKSE